MQALIKPCNLPQTQSKSDIKLRKLEQFENQNSVNGIEPMEGCHFEYLINLL